MECSPVNGAAKYGALIAVNATIDNSRSRTYGIP
jgi:hypothetical protein